MNMQYSLSQLLEIADRGFKTLFGGFDFWGTAEILKIQQKGKYVYLEMVEYDSEGKITAKVKGCIFDEHVYKTFLKETGVGSIEEMNGLKILFHGRFSFHKDYNFSIIIDELSVEYMLGQLQKKQNTILADLLKLGILTNNRQLQWGYPPYNIAVISSKDAAGLHDFQAVIAHSEYKITYEYYFGAMHGNNAIEAVREQLESIQSDISQGKQIDAVVLVRGGGESSGITWQNDFEIAKLICTMKAPVIVAIGHTPDKTILQELAWYGAKTPTDAAYKILEMCTFWEGALQYLYDQITEKYADKMIEIRENIDYWHESISEKLSRFMKDTRRDIDSRYTTICTISPEKMLVQGYALLLQNGHYLDTIAVNTLTEGDSIQIKVYDTVLDVSITRIQKKK